MTLALSAVIASALFLVSHAYPSEILHEQNYPALERLLSELQHNEESIKNLEVDQSQLQAKISKSKVELNRRQNIVQTLEERQRLEIGRLHNQITALQRHILALESSNEQMRQKLLRVQEQAIYGDGRLVGQVEHLRDQNGVLRNRQLQHQLEIRELLQPYSVYERPTPPVSYPYAPYPFLQKILYGL